MKTTLQIRDPKTGEMRDHDFYSKEPKPNFNREFKFIGDSAMEMLLRAKLKPSDIRVMLALMHFVEWGHVAKMPRKALIEMAGLTREQTGRSLASLKRLGFIIGDPDDPNRFELDPVVCWKGRPDQRPGAIFSYYSKTRVVAMDTVIRASGGNPSGQLDNSQL